MSDNIPCRAALLTSVISVHLLRPIVSGLKKGPDLTSKKHIAIVGSCQEPFKTTNRGIFGVPALRC